MKLSQILCITVQEDRDTLQHRSGRWSVLLVGADSQEAPVEGVHKERALEIAMAIRKHADWAEFLVEGTSGDPGLRRAAKNVVEAWEAYIDYNHAINRELHGGVELVMAMHKLARYTS